MENLNEKIFSMFNQVYLNPDKRFNFDSFFKNTFEAELFVELDSDDLKSTYFGGALNFIGLLRQFLLMINTKLKPSVNFKLLFEYSRNNFNQVEIKYLFSKITSVIDLININSNKINRGYIQLPTNIDETNNLECLKQLLILYCNKHEEFRNIIKEGEQGENVLLLKSSNDIVVEYIGGNDNTRISLDYKWEIILKLIDFLSHPPIKKIVTGRPDFNSEKPFLDVENYQKLQNYLKDIVYQGIIQNDYGVINFDDRIDKQVILYTFNLIRYILSGAYFEESGLPKRANPNYALLRILLHMNLFANEKIQFKYDYNSDFHTVINKMKTSNIVAKLTECPKVYHFINKEFAPRYMK